MKKLRNYFLLAAMAVSAVCVGFSSCSKDGDDDPAGGGGGAAFDGKTVIGTVSSSTAPSSVDSVGVVIMQLVSGQWMTTWCRGSYSEGKFTLTLPDALDEKLLDEPSDTYPFNKLEFFSDKTVKCCFIDEIYAYNGEMRNGYHVGSFTANIMIVYVDKPVTLNATGIPYHSYGYTCTNVSLKQGWNMLYFTGATMSSSGTVTTSNPGGLEWTYKSK